MPDQIHSYVDEAGDPTLFGSKRGSGVIVGNDGCSKFSVMWPQIGEIHDLDHGRPGGTFFKAIERPTAETAFPRKHEEKKKKPRI